MSPIAKIFSIVNLVLAGLFLGWAANALSTNAEFKSKYEAEVTAHKADQATLGSEKSALLTQKQEAEKQADRLRAEKDEADRKREAVEKDLESERAKNGTMNASLTTLSTQLGAIEDTRNKLQADKDKAQQAVHDAEKARDAAVAKQLEAEKKLGDTEGELTKATNQIADLEKANTTLEKEKQSVDTQLATVLAATNSKVSDYAAMPLIEGKVLDVSTSIEPGLVAINKGDTDKVKVGYTFEIYDGKTYKGQARVEYVHPNMCSAILVRTVKGTTIRQGDSAATRLN
jgi:small-conductance mechanosensitive channel